MIKSASQSSLTTDIKYRNMGAANVPSNEYLIETAIVNSTVPSVTFSNLSQWAGIYRHLQIVYCARGDWSTGARPLVISFNGVTGLSYSSHDLFNNGSSVASSGTVSSTNVGGSYFGYIAAAANAAENFGAGVSDILDAFSTTKNKVFRTLSGMTGDGAQILINSGCFLNTAAIDSISLRASSGNIVANSRFSIYGVTA